MEFKRIEAEIKRLNWMGEVGSLDDEDIEWLKELEDLFALRIVSHRRELLKALLNTDTDVELITGKKVRLLKYTEEAFLIQYNHNDKIEWVGTSEIKTKSLL